MKLIKARIREFQSIIDSNEFEIGDITCFVGKNEAGKTALLKALYRLNPIDPTDGLYDVTHDYPRNQVEDYRFAVESKQRLDAIVVEAHFALDDDDLGLIKKELGEEAVTDRHLVLTKGYGSPRDGYTFRLSGNLVAVLDHLYSTADLTVEIKKKLDKTKDVDTALELLTQEEQTSEVIRVTSLLTEIKGKGINKFIFDKFLDERVPKFLYFDEYYQMSGLENIPALIARKNSTKLKRSDYPILGLVELARLNLTELEKPEDTQELKNKLQGAGNYLSNQVLKYWSQNRHIQMQFDVRPGLAKDPEEMREGMNIWAEVFDFRHKVSTNLGTRSRGFVWFFSFLAWYSQIKRQNQRVILLLDEPGLTLHGKAQEDLLKYFEAEIHNVHQLIYSTHSPFMVDSSNFSRVRIVQDKGIDSTEPLPPEDEGTRVIASIEDASEDSLFPLQGALGYEIYQSLFIGPNSLIVEGTSDLIYIQTISAYLESQGKVGLSPQWTITPVGGSDKVPTFVSLIGSQKGLRIATLIDFQKKDQQKIENLYKKRLLKKNHVLTYADFVGSGEADVEDMFEKDFYLSLVNNEYQRELSKKILVKNLNSKISRITQQLDEYFRNEPLKGGVHFNHFRPARFLSENIKTFGPKLSSSTISRFEEAFKAVNSLLR